MFKAYIAHMHRTSLIKVGITGYTVDKRCNELCSHYGAPFVPLYTFDIADATFERQYPATALEAHVRHRFQNSHHGLVPANSREFYDITLVIHIADYIRYILDNRIHMKRTWDGRIRHLQRPYAGDC